MYTTILPKGREIFVGVSQRTNLSGALAVASAFPEFYVTPINVPRKVTHLKSCVSMAGPDILCVGSSPEAQEILRVRSNASSGASHTLGRVVMDFTSFPFFTAHCIWSILSLYHHHRSRQWVSQHALHKWHFGWVINGGVLNCKISHKHCLFVYSSSPLGISTKRCRVCE